MIVELASSTICALERKSRECKIKEQLEMLSDQELDDIGLARDDIDLVIRNAQMSMRSAYHQ